VGGGLRGAPGVAATHSGASGAAVLHPVPLDCDGHGSSGAFRSVSWLLASQIVDTASQPVSQSASPLIAMLFAPVGCDWLAYCYLGGPDIGEEWFSGDCRSR
jgi:hypothetical protein